MARTHPGETCSNFTLEAFIEKLIATSILLYNYDFYIIPMVNPDGVFLGNHRTGIVGIDLNRKFNSNDE
jgi:murein tripeptide amidase MpaA